MGGNSIVHVLKARIVLARGDEMTAREHVLIAKRWGTPLDRIAAVSVGFAPDWETVDSGIRDLWAEAEPGA